MSRTIQRMLERIQGPQDVDVPRGIRGETILLGIDGAKLATFGPAALGIEGTIEYFERMRRARLEDYENSGLEYRLLKMRLLSQEMISEDEE